jgi:monoterpene epsilon-lactone hydrolase
MSIQLFVVDKVLRVTAKRQFAKNPDVMQLRVMMASMKPPRVPERVSVSSVSLGGVRTEKLVPQQSDERRAVLYIHGGGFVGGEPANHRAITWRLAEKIGVPIFAVDYRLAPEHTFPAGLEDCTSAYRALLDMGVPPGGIAVGGDSAGGNLTLALALKLKALDLPQPAALFCLSPATDLAGSTPSHAANARSDAMFDLRMFDSVVQLYCPGSDARDPLISPLRGDVTGLPPTLIQCSGLEMLRDDGVLMAQKLKDAGVPVKLEVWPKTFHAWQIMADAIPESRRAIDAIASFVSGHLQR